MQRTKLVETERKEEQKQTIITWRDRARDIIQKYLESRGPLDFWAKAKAKKLIEYLEKCRDNQDAFNEFISRVNHLSGRNLKYQLLQFIPVVQKEFLNSCNREMKEILTSQVALQELGTFQIMRFITRIQQRLTDERVPKLVDFKYHSYIYFANPKLIQMPSYRSEKNDEIPFSEIVHSHIGDYFNASYEKWLSIPPALENIGVWDHSFDDNYCFGFRLVCDYTGYFELEWPDRSGYDRVHNANVLFYITTDDLYDYSCDYNRRCAYLTEFLEKHGLFQGSAPLRRMVVDYASPVGLIEYKKCPSFQRM